MPYTGNGVTGGSRVTSFSQRNAADAWWSRFMARPRRRGRSGGGDLLRLDAWPDEGPARSAGRPVRCDAED
ncbi:hypothetical protein GCM10009678_67630 [Actinomadura kijaniata]